MKISYAIHHDIDNAVFTARHGGKQKNYKNERRQCILNINHPTLIFLE